MKLEKLIFTATIPTGQYSNIQPTIEMSDVSLAEGEKIAMDFIKELFVKYSPSVKLQEHDPIKELVG